MSSCLWRWSKDEAVHSTWFWMQSWGICQVSIPSLRAGSLESGCMDAHQCYCHRQNFLGVLSLEVGAPTNGGFMWSTNVYQPVTCAVWPRGLGSAMSLWSVLELTCVTWWAAGQWNQTEQCGLLQREHLMLLLVCKWEMWGLAGEQICVSLTPAPW